MSKWPNSAPSAQKTGLSGAFINLLRLPVDNFASGSIVLTEFYAAQANDG